MRFLVFLGILAGLVGAAILAGRLFPSENDRIRSRIDALVRALEQEDVAAFEEALGPSFRYEGVAGSGDRDAAIARVRRLAAEPEALTVRIGELEADFEGDLVRLRIVGSGFYGTRERSPGRDRFVGTGGPFEARLELRRSEEGPWTLESVSLESWNPFARTRERRR